MPDAGGADVAAAAVEPTSTGGTMTQPKGGKTVHTQIDLLDGSIMDLYIERKMKGEEVLTAVCENLNIVEKDYFGLSLDIGGISSWLPVDARVAKYIKGEPWRLTFEVKFYPPDPSLLHEDITRYYLCLQIRNDILSEKLPCSFVTYALLGSYLVQSEMGDYDPMEHSDTSYLKEFRFAPKQTNELEQKVVELHKTHKGQTPAEAELHYLENAKKLAMYGVDMHPAKDSANVDIMLGVCASGIQVFRDKLKINRFAWPKILKISYKKNFFYIKIRPGQFEQYEPTIVFKLASHKAAKRLWKTCVEHHTFFRLTSAEPVSKSSLMPRLSSKFRHSGNTYYESRKQTIDRQQPQFNRVHSTRKFASLSMEPVSVKKKDAEAESKRHTMPIAPDHIPGVDSNISPANKRLREKKPVGGVAVLPVMKKEPKDKGPVHSPNTNGVGNHHENEDEMAANEANKENRVGGVNRSFIENESTAVVVTRGKESGDKNEQQPASPDRLHKLRSPSSGFFSWGGKSSRDKKQEGEKTGTAKKDKDDGKKSKVDKKDKKAKKEAVAVELVDVQNTSDEGGKRGFWGKREKGDKSSMGQLSRGSDARSKDGRGATETSLETSIDTTLEDSTFNKTSDSLTLEGSKFLDQSGTSDASSRSPGSPSTTGGKNWQTVVIGSQETKGASKETYIGASSKGSEGETSNLAKEIDLSVKPKTKGAHGASEAWHGGSPDIISSKGSSDQYQNPEDGAIEPSSPTGTGTKGMKAFAATSEKSRLSLGGLFGKKDKSKHKEEKGSPSAEDKSKDDKKKKSKEKEKDKDKKSGKESKSKSDKENKEKGDALLVGTVPKEEVSKISKDGAIGENLSPDQSLVSDKDRSMDSTLVEPISPEQLANTPSYTKQYVYTADVEEDRKTRLPGAFSYEAGRIDGASDGSKSDKPVSPGSKQTGLAFNYAPGENIAKAVSPSQMRSLVSTFKTEEAKESKGDKSPSYSEVFPSVPNNSSESSTATTTPSAGNVASSGTFISGGDRTQETPKVIKTTTVQSVVKDKGELTQNIQQTIEDLNSKEVWFNEQHNKAEGLVEGEGSPYIQATSVTTRTALTHEDLGTNAKTSQVEEKTVATSNTLSGTKREQRVVTQQVKATTSTVLNDLQLASGRRSSSSSESSDDSGTPIDGDPVAETYYVNSSFQEPIVETETKVYETVEGGDDDDDQTTTTVPLVPTHLMETGSYTTKAEVISSQTITKKTRTVETTTYKTEKDGLVETRVEQKITIESDGDPIDHDKALAEAIQEATAMNPNMTVEKIEIQQQ